MPVFDESLNITHSGLFFKDNDSGQYKPLSLGPVVMGADLAPPYGADNSDYEQAYRSFVDTREFSFTLSKRQINRTLKSMKKAENQAKHRRRNRKRVNEKMRRLVLKGEGDKWLCLIFSDGRLSLRQKKNFKAWKADAYRK